MIRYRFWYRHRGSLFLVWVMFVVFVFCPLSYGQEGTQRVCVRNTCLLVEIADTDAQRQRGLMYRESLPENQGMLFVFEEEGRYGFWMKNMKFPIDILWINEDKKIVEIKSNVGPCKEECESLIPKEEAKYVLEVIAGFAVKYQLKIGDRVDF